MVSEVEMKILKKMFASEELFVQDVLHEKCARHPSEQKSPSLCVWLISYIPFSMSILINADEERSDKR